MKEFIAKYQKAIVGTGAIAVLTLCYFQQKELAKLRSEKSVSIESKATIDSLQHVVDSLDAELFPVRIELGRYEVAYQIFMERNPKAAEQYGTIISEETE